MAQIFVFTAGDDAARAHLADSIDKPIEPAVAFEAVGQAGQDQLQLILDQEGGLWAWGAVPGDRNRLWWEQMSKGDWVLCVYQNTYHYVARVALKLEDDALARQIWGQNPEGQTWSLMYFPSRPTKVNTPVGSVASYLNNGYRGFTRIGDERVARIETEFGSLDQFMRTRILNTESALPRHFLIRSNEESAYGDEIGVRYHFTNTVPNSRALATGGRVVVDRKAPGGAVLIGYGQLERAMSKEERGKTHFASSFKGWTAFEPARPLDAVERAAIQAMPGYNVQHAIRPITREIYDMLTRTSVESPPAEKDLRKAADAFATALREADVSFGAQHDGLVRAFLASLATKPLAILTGLSGSGKTQIAMRLGEWLGPGCLSVTAVRPDWTGAEALFRYEDGLRPAKDGQPAWVVPEPLSFMLKARDDPENTHLLVLDEMNLAHVERYFADALSGMESEQPCLPNLTLGTDGVWRMKPAGGARVPLPKNLWIVGTVNVDETTYMFSPKVLDRANTFEFRVRGSDLSQAGRKPRPCRAGDPALVRGLLAIARDSEWHLRNPATFAAELVTRLRSLHEVLARYSYEFGHRVFYESLRFAAMAEQAGLGGLTAALDRIVMQKVLPRLHGARRRLEPPLLALMQFCGDLPVEPPGDTELAKLKVDERLEPAELPLPFDKAHRMLRSLRANQFASFTE